MLVKLIDLDFGWEHEYSGPFDNQPSALLNQFPRIQMVVFLKIGERVFCFCKRATGSHDKLTMESETRDLKRTKRDVIDGFGALGLIDCVFTILSK
jgi:hypothetical protein